MYISATSGSSGDENEYLPKYRDGVIWLHIVSPHGHYSDLTFSSLADIDTFMAAMAALRAKVVEETREPVGDRPLDELLDRLEYLRNKFATSDEYMDGEKEELAELETWYNDYRVDMAHNGPAQDEE